MVPLPGGIYPQRQGFAAPTSMKSRRVFHEYRHREMRILCSSMGCLSIPELPRGIHSSHLKTGFLYVQGDLSGGGVISLRLSSMPEWRCRWGARKGLSVTIPSPAFSNPHELLVILSLRFFSSWLRLGSKPGMTSAREVLPHPGASDHHQVVFARCCDLNGTYAQGLA